MESSLKSCRISCKFPLLLSLSVLVAVPSVHGQSAADYYRRGAKHYVKNQTADARRLVDEGLKVYPDNVPLQRLDELLKKQQQSQSSDKNDKSDSEQKDEQQKQEEQKKEEQQKQEKQKQQESEQQKQDQQQQQKPSEQQQQQQQGDKGEKPEDEKQAAAQKARAIPMTQQEAERLLDSLKAEQKAMIFVPQIRTNRPDRVFKDW